MEKLSFLGRVFLLVGIIDAFAASMVSTLLPLYLHSSKLSYFSAGLIGTIYGGVQILSSPIVGNWSDNKGLKYCLVVTLMCTGTSYLILGMTQYIVVISVARFISGMFKHTHHLCKAYLVDVLTSSERTYALSYYNAATTFGFIIGPSISGHLAEHHCGFSIVCCISSVLFYLNACIVAAFVPKENAIKFKEKTFSHVSYSSLLLLYWDIFMIQFLFTFPTFLNRTSLPLQLRVTVGILSKEVGYIISFQGFLNCLSNLLIGNFYYACKSTQILLTLTAITQILFLLGLIFATEVWLILICLIPLAFTHNIIKIAVNNMTVERKKDFKLGTVIGLGESVTSGSRMLSPVVVGFQQNFSLHAPNVTGMLCTFLGALFLIIFRPCKLKVKKF